jgi:hypothetical protein
MYEVWKTPMRYIVARICIDENGVYSIDGPSQEQGGTVGFGTTQYGDKPANIDGTAEGVRAMLKMFHDYLLHEAHKRSQK